MPGKPSDDPTSSGASAGASHLRTGGSTASVSSSVAEQIATAASSALPKIGDVSFCTFTLFLVLLLMFSGFCNIILTVVVRRARGHGLDVPILPEMLHYVWVFFQLVIFVDLIVTYCMYYSQWSKNSERRKISGSRFLQPHIWSCCSWCLRLELAPRSFLMLLAVVLPLNALFFYQDLGRPVYTTSRLMMYESDDLLAGWPRAGGLEVDTTTWHVRDANGQAFEPPLRISGKECYSYDSVEFQILGRLQEEEMPKQAYCESLIGSMMVDWRKHHQSSRAWQHDEDKWDEAFEFALRLFSSLAGVVADSLTSGISNAWFLRDMTDVFDMYFLTFADVDQMREGRPLLAGSHKIAYTEYRWPYHNLVCAAIWVAFVVVFLRALATSGFQPHVWLARRCGCTAETERVQNAFDALFSLLFVEGPFLTLRWLAWSKYGLPVSIMGVKNVFGIYEDLYMLGIVRGFGAADDKPRGLQLCCPLCGCCKRRAQDPKLPGP